MKPHDLVSWYGIAVKKQAIGLRRCLAVTARVKRIYRPEQKLDIKVFSISSLILLSLFDLTFSELILVHCVPRCSKMKFERAKVSKLFPDISL